jgi:hypothetical protein
MLKALDNVIEQLPFLMNNRSQWSSLIVNRRKPWTFRAFTDLTIDGHSCRICLHRFEVCDEEESFIHPHPWAGAFLILQGSYLMSVGFSQDRFSKPESVMKVILAAGSRYTITNPLTWHSVTPLEECYTVMVNAAPWDKETVAHTQIRTTKGKDLDSMSSDDLDAHFAKFRSLLGNKR